MKIHRRILTHYLSCTSPVDKEGYLYKRRDRKSSYLRRWFILKGNLLFYQACPAERQPLGVIVLEGGAVLAGDSERSFSLVFSGPGLRTYHLVADTRPGQRSWITALLTASHAHVSLLLRDLAHLYQEVKEGRSSGGPAPSSTTSESMMDGSTCSTSSSTFTSTSCSSSTSMASVYPGPSPFTTCRETRSHSDSCVPHAAHHHAHHHAHHRRSPWPRRGAHVTPVRGPAPLRGEWPRVNFDPLGDFVSLHEHYGSEVRQLRDDWLEKKRREAEHVDLS